MYPLLFLIFVFLPSAAYSLDLKSAELFIKGLKEKNFCSHEFINLKKTDLREVVLLLSSLNCSPNVVSELPPPKNPYGKLEVARALKKTGKEEKARELYTEIFETTNLLDEEVLNDNAGNFQFLFKPRVLRKKVWRAARKGEIGKALFYLSFLREDPYYEYLLAYTLMKNRKWKLSRLFFKASSEVVPESYFFLMYLSRGTAEKFFYYRKLMESSAKRSFKRSASYYILDKLFLNDFGLFRRALKLSSEFPDIYTYYKARYLVFNLDCKGLKSLKQTKVVKALEESCKLKKFNWKGTDFYSLLLSPPRKFPFRRSEIFNKLKLKDAGLLELYRNDLCYAISFIDRPSPQNALALYLCKEYRKGIKLASPFRKKLKEYPYLLAVLYPNPPLFRNDIYSLSIARQESLFQKRALSKSGAIGLMQIMPKTGKHIAGKLGRKKFKVEELFNDRLNYTFGSYYIHSLIRKFKLFPLAAAAYNGGPSRVRRALKLFGKVKSPEDLILFNEVYIPFRETRDYVKRTYVNLYYYSNLYGKGKEWRIFSSR